MALIAHWPLNGNLNDISGNGINSTLQGATTDPAGKIGSSYSFANTRIHTADFNNYLSSNSYSYCVWINRSSSQNEYNMFMGQGLPYFSFRAGGQLFWSNAVNGTQRSVSTSETYSNNIWYHFTATYDGTYMKIFVNGIEKASSSQPGIMSPGWEVPFSIGDGTNGTWYPFYGKVNDVRIYDHALTDMEIQEIARAKILHYTFDDIQEPTTNILSDLNISQWSQDNSCTVVDTGTFYMGEKIYRATFPASGLPRFRLNFPYTPGFYSGSFYYRHVSGTSIMPTFYFRESGFGTSYASTSLQKDYSWNRIPLTYNFTTSGTSMFLVYRTGDHADPLVMDICMPQLETKQYITEFTTGSRIGQVNDYSGFFNYSNIIAEVDTPRWIPEAKIGTGAYQFFGVGGSGTSGNVISFPNSTSQLNVGINNAFTISFWIKPVATSAAAVIRKGGQFELYVTGSNFVYRVWDPTQRDYTSTATYSANNWYHIVMMHDGVTTGKLYINGSLDRTITVSGTPSGTSGDLTIGAYANRTWSMGGVLDDVRIYSTALSDKDILDLYNTRAEIEQSGVLYARDFLSNAEDTVNLISGVIDTTFETTTGLSIYSGTTTVSSETTFNGHKVYKVIPAASGASGFNITSNIYVPASTIANMSFWVYIPENQTINGTFEIHRHALPDAQCLEGNCHWYSSIDYTNRTWDNSSPKGKWFRREITIQTSSYVPVYGYYLRSFVYNGGSTGGGYFYVTEPQIELKLDPTPFTTSYRPLSELPSTIEFGADEVHETGTANFEDFSTVGITDGMNTYIPLNDNTIRDLSGSPYTITVTSDPIYRGDYYRFDGIDDQINTGNNAVTNWDTPFTLMVSIRVPTEYDRQVSVQTAIIGRGSYTGSVGLTINSTNSFNFFLRTSGASFSAALGTFDRDVWYHLVGTYDGTNIRSYRNGVLSATTAVSNKDGTPSGTTWLVTPSMAFSGSSGGRLLADMNNIKVFNRALTAEEIAIEYNTMFNNEVQIHESGIVYAKDLIQY
jgi:hypothetical protein